MPDDTPPAAPTPDTARLVFAHTVRGVKRFADPLAVKRNLLRASQGQFEALERLASSAPTPLEQEDAREKLHAITCAAFDLVPFDAATGEGVTETESVAVLDEFLSWLAGSSA